VVEAGISLLLGHGIATASALQHDRVWRYFDQYRAAGGRAPMRSILQAAGLNRSLAGAESYVASPGLYQVSKAQNSSRVESTLAPLKVRTGALSRRIANNLRVTDVARSPTRAGTRQESIEEVLRESLTRLKSQRDVEIHALNDRVCSATFEHPLTLRTHTALAAATSAVLRRAVDEATAADSDRQVVLKIAASGGGYLKERPARRHIRTLTKQANVSFDVLLSFEEFVEPVGDLLGSRRSSCSVTWVPWWFHNRHLTLLSVDGRPISAVYFVRRLRSLVITPVYLTNPRDVKAVEAFFDQRRGEADLMQTAADRRVSAVASSGSTPN
jgi:hypothetical protein